MSSENAQSVEKQRLFRRVQASDPAWQPAAGDEGLPGTQPLVAMLDDDGVTLGFERDSWRVAWRGDGEQLTVAEAVELAGQYRPFVLKQTRRAIAWMGERLAKEVWISPTAPKQPAMKGVDPKLPPATIAEVGEIIARLGRELGTG